MDLSDIDSGRGGSGRCWENPITSPGDFIKMGIRLVHILTGCRGSILFPLPSHFVRVGAKYIRLLISNVHSGFVCAF